MLTYLLSHPLVLTILTMAVIAAIGAVIPKSKRQPAGVSSRG